MTEIQIDSILEQDEAVRGELLKLNNEHARETSLLTIEQWQALLDRALSATCVTGAAGFLIALDQDAGYDNENFNWFRSRLSRFIYIDRIVISESLRGMGAANRMYSNLFQIAEKAGHDHIVCEVNQVPPNIGSDRFHAKMGFSKVGHAKLKHSNKTVGYLAKRLDGMPVQL